jgi:exosortase
MEAASRIPAGNSPTSWRLIGYLLLCFIPIVLTWDLVRLVATLALDNDTYSHIPLIPLVSVYLIYFNRRSIFSNISTSWASGIALMGPGAIAIVAARLNVWHLSSANQLSLIVLGFVIIWIGSFGLVFGTSSFHSALFPLLFLLFMVPIPEPLLSKSIAFLQEESARATAVMFGVLGVPFLQNDLVFTLPGMAIRVAKECSGIRSTLALLIMTVLASHMFLRTTWKQVLVCCLVVPLSIAKNGLRIATLSALAVYVDPQFLTGPIHHEFGGMLFFAAAFVPLALLFVVLQKTESTKTESDPGPRIEMIGRSVGRWSVFSKSVKIHWSGK